jgi:phosphatidylinositol-3-phosphatase
VADLQSETPNLAVIVPNQCHDRHGLVLGGTAICASTPSEVGSFMLQRDAELAKLVTGIKVSSVWRHGRNAIPLVWDENDFSDSQQGAAAGQARETDA